MGKEKQQTIRQTYGIVILVSLLAALLLEGFLAVQSVHHGKNSQGMELWPGCFLYSSGYEISGCQKGKDTGGETISQTEYFSQTDGDPQMYFEASGIPYGRIRIRFGEPAEEEIQGQIYHALSGEVYVQRIFIQKGSTEAEVNLRCRDYGQMRIDLDGSFALESIEAYPVVPWNQISILRSVSQWSLGRFLTEWILLLSAFISIQEYIRKYKRDSRLDFSKTEMKASRFIYLDVLRTMAAFFAVAVHVAEPVILEYERGTAVWKILSGGTLILLACNPLFLMISGSLLVKDRNETALEFYQKRFGKIAVPLVLFYLLYMAASWTGNLTVVEWIKLAVQTILTGSCGIAPHLWLVYVLIIIYFFVPVLRKSVGRLGETGGKRLFAIIVFLLSCGAFLKSRGMGGSLWFNGILWLGIFVSGYLIHQPYMRKYDGLFGIFGLMMAALSYQVMVNRPDYKQIVFNGSVLIVGISWALYAAAVRAERMFRRVAGGLAFLGKHSFSVLLVHWLVLYGILMNGGIPGLQSHGLLIRLTGTFLAVILLSLTASVIMDDLIQPGLEKMVKFLWNKTAGKAKDGTVFRKLVKNS